MRKAGILAAGIASGGLLLGLLLGSAVAPEMKEPPTPSWQQDDDGNLDRSAPDRSIYASIPPETNTARSFGGSRPELDYSAEAWSPRLPAYELAPLSDEYEAHFAYDDSPAIRDTSGAEEAAENARAAVEEARAADPAPDPAPAPAAPEVRKSELARTGLY